MSGKKRPKRPVVFLDVGNERVKLGFSFVIGGNGGRGPEGIDVADFVHVNGTFDFGAKRGVGGDD